jgi:N utilization substance protein B
MNIKNNNEHIHDYIHDRRDGRILAFQVLFSYDFCNKKLAELKCFDWLENERFSAKATQYAEFLIEGTVNNLEKIDNMIKSKLKNWDFERISNIDKAVLRFSIFSLLFENDVPDKVIINEAIEIVKKFGGKDSYKFINGILDAIKKTKESSK